MIKKLVFRGNIKVNYVRESGHSDVPGLFLLSLLLKLSLNVHKMSIFAVELKTWDHADNINQGI